MDSVVIGGGAWGTAIANLLSFNTLHVPVLSRNTKVIDSINKSHINTVYLPTFRLNENITATDKPEILNRAELIFFAIPSQSMRFSIRELKKYIQEGAQIVLCNKGIEKDSLLLMSEVVHEELPKANIFVLSGPNFAHEILAGKYSFSNLAGQDKTAYIKIARAISTPTFFTKYIKDMNGAQVLASFKNVMAIICGLLVRLGAEFNTLSALVSVALEEVKPFLKIKQGNLNTVTEFCGVGDLVLTCFSDKSRNFRFGYNLIDGEKDTTLVEGRSTLESLYALARIYNIDSILINTLHDIIGSSSEDTYSFEQEVKRKLDLAFMHLSDIHRESLNV